MKHSSVDSMLRNQQKTITDVPADLVQSWQGNMPSSYETPPAASNHGLSRDLCIFLIIQGVFNICYFLFWASDVMLKAQILQTILPRA